ncbi:MAG: type II toxin-antitoxin system RelE/ParE family toxin [Holosporales bacterium]|jgi:proteic killer suppression protein
MIKSFSCKETAKIWEGEASRKLPSTIHDRALRKLRQLDAALTLEDLRNPPGNNLEALLGDKKGYYSIRISGQWRLMFSLINNHSFDVRIIDYH